MDRKNLNIHTKAVQGTDPIEKTHGAIATPIYAVSTFAFKDSAQGAALFAKEEDGYIYSRLGNPTNHKLDKNIALLENAEDALSFSSGMGAVNCVVLHHCGAGDHLLAQATLYGGTFDLFKNQYPRFGIEVTFVNSTDPADFAAEVRPNTKLIYCETPSNPTLEIIDIEGVAKIAKDAGVPLVVDNTFATPILQRPIDLGADIVLHSCTKYIGGHGDAIGGVLASKKETINAMRTSTYKDFGANPSPLNSFLFIRGLKTLALRMERHCANAEIIANFLDNHPKVNRVYYPGLKNHSGYELAKKQMSGKFGGMIGFEVSDFESACKFLDSLDLCIQAVSLGDILTLIEHPASTTHCSYTEEELSSIGLKPGYIRLSVGIEDVDDLIADIEQGLSKI